MSYEYFDKLKAMYTQLIELVCYSKETDSEDEKIDCFLKMFQIVRTCLKFSPYTHFYTQVLIDIIVKTYNTKVFRSDLLFKSQIGVFIEETKYSPNDFFSELEEDEYTTQILLLKWVQEIDKISAKKHNEYMKFFETMRDLLIENLIEKKTDLKERLELISKYSNNSKEKHIVAEEVYELQNTEEQIRFELFKVIQNNFTINKCENCGRLFIPTTTSNNPNQKGRNDQKYCNNLYLNTSKTCREIGALNKQKEKVKNSLILKEYNREYKRMHGLHYNHTKEFKEKQFKEWSQKARELRDSYIDNQIEEFKIELKKLSNMYQIYVHK